MSVQKDPIIEVKGLTKKFGDFIALDNLNFEVNTGEIIGFLGPNGSGKTTAIRLLLGLLSPSGGYAKVLGYDSYHQSDQVRSHVGYMSQKFAIYDDLTVRENLEFYGGVYGIQSSKRILEVCESVGLINHLNGLTRELSTGWRQRLALGIALVHHPRLLFLDEPTSGVDPNARRAFWDLIYSLANQGVTILVTTHYMDEAEYCGRVAIMRSGRLLAMDTPSDLKKSIVNGKVIEIITSRLTECLSWAEEQKIIRKTSLSGDHLKVILNENYVLQDLREAVCGTPFENDVLVSSEPGLDDVFALLTAMNWN